MPPLENKINYDSFRDCTISGYKESLKILQAFSLEEFKEKKLYISFACTEQETT